MKILIVSVFFPPKNSIASQRPYSWAKHLSRMGHDVTVLTTQKISQDNDLFAPARNFELIEVAVPGMATLSRFLGKPGELGSSPGNETRPGLLLALKQWVIGRIRHIQQTYGVMYACRMPEIHDLWAFSAYRRIPPGTWDLVITTAWPYSVHFIGWMLKKRHRTKLWIADWRDLWTDNHMYPGLPMLRKVERWLEKKFNMSADIITTVSEPLAHSLAKCGNSAQVIYNGFDEEDYAALTQQAIFPDDGKIRIVYTGSLYPGKRDPSPLFQAIAHLAHEGILLPGKLEVIFASKLLDVAGLAEQFGVSSYVTSLGFLPREQALCMQRDADVLLFLEFEAPGVEGILTGKLFEYLHAGPPILAIGISQDSTAGGIIHASGRGCSLGRDIQKIQAWLEYLLKNNSPPPLPPAEMDIQVYSRASQARKLLELTAPPHSQPL